MSRRLPSHPGIGVESDHLVHVRRQDGEKFTPAAPHVQSCVAALWQVRHDPTVEVIGVTPWVARIQPVHTGCQSPARKRARESSTRHEGDHCTPRYRGGPELVGAVYGCDERRGDVAGAERADRRGLWDRGHAVGAVLDWGGRIGGGLESLQ